jgi:hypothetical protein
MDRQEEIDVASRKSAFRGSKFNKPANASGDHPAPFGKLDLGDELRLEPHTVFHLFPGQSPLRPRGPTVGTQNNGVGP